MPDTIHDQLRQKQLMEVNVTDSYIDHYYREPSNRRNEDGNPVPDRVFIERYVSTYLGKLELLRVIEGVHIPGFYTPETFTFTIEDLSADYVQYRSVT